MKTTGNYGLKKPDGTDLVNVEDLNGNMDIIDTKLKEVVNHAGDGVKHITAAERNTWNAKAGTAVATTTTNGLMAAADKVKLNQVLETVSKIYTIDIVPSQSGTLTYTGNAQSPNWNNYDSAKMTLGGTTNGTNAGNYNATFTPTSNYKWSDESTATKSVVWSISKAAGSLTLNKSSLTLSGNTTTDIVTATRTGNGTITASSNDTSVATVSVSGMTITIKAVATGATIVTVSCAAGTNHNAPASKTINITVSIPDKTLANNTPAMIKEVTQSGQAPNLWRVGDKIPININGKVGSLAINGTYYAFILGFNHNSGLEGGNSIHFQFGKNASGTDITFVDNFQMNTTNTNSGGWNGSYMKQTICPAFFNALPTEWKNVIVTCTKYTDNTGGGSTSPITATQDKIWLLAEFEAFGAYSYANDTEQNYQKQYDYYKNGNSKIKYRHNNTGSANAWWLRSLYASTKTGFCVVHAEGRSSTIYNCSSSSGFAPGFKIA